jgi:septal ring factor EnvC (AmiA/AmiB activator)
MKTRLSFHKSPSSPATEVNPAASALTADERSVLTARIAALLEENNQLLRELASARAERDALERALNALKRRGKERNYPL